MSSVPNRLYAARSPEGVELWIPESEMPGGGGALLAGNNLSDVNSLLTSYRNLTPTTQTLTDAATVAWDVALGPVAKVTLGGNRTLGAPASLQDGGTYILRVTQDGTGSRTLAYNAVFKWPGGVAPTLSTAVGAIDVLTFVSNGTNLYGVAQKAFS